ncbi:hypothetical protein Tco_0323766 [Tanacetum coccineum]
MDTTIHHEDLSGQTSSPFTVPIMVILEIMYTFTTTIPPPHPFFNPLPQQATLNPTTTALEVSTSFSALPDFASIFRFNDRVTNLERDLLAMKQVDQYAQAISSIPAIVDRYIDNKLGEGIQQVIKIYNSCDITESLEAAILAKSSSQPMSTYEAATSLFEFELTKILMDKMEENKSYLRAYYKRELYDALVKSYNTDKDLFDTYGNNQEFNVGNNDEQPDDKAVSKSDWYKKPEQPSTPDPE